MSHYLRTREPGACYFFTVVTHKRQPLFSNRDNIALLRESFRYILDRRPFVLEAITVLPDHLHCLWQLPENDADYSERWKILKTYFTRKHYQKRVWQPRFWEHCIRDESDWKRHLDYIHYNPVKHGYVTQPGEWRYSSFHRFLNRGYYLSDWGVDAPEDLRGIDWE